MEKQQRNTSLCMILASAFLAMVGTQCNKSNCEDLRDELFALRRSWQPCQEHTDCILVGGNPKDCTGILTCNLAVNRDKRLEAERRIASLPEETLDCMECQSPNCVKGEIPYCEPVTHQCIIVTEVLDAGLLSMDIPSPSEPEETGGRSSRDDTATGGRSSLVTGGTGGSGATGGGVVGSGGTSGAAPVEGAAGALVSDAGTGNLPLTTGATILE